MYHEPFFRSLVFLCFSLIHAMACFISDSQIFEQMANERGTVLYGLQKKFQAMFGFTLPLFHGRGMLNCVYLLFSVFFLYISV